MLAMLTILPPRPAAIIERGRDLGGEQHRPGVDAEDPVPLVGGDVEQRGDAEHAGVVDEDVDAAEPVDRRLGRFGGGGRIGEVADHGDARQLVGHRAALLGEAVDDGDRGALGGEAPGDRRPDATGATGDDDARPDETLAGGGRVGTRFDHGGRNLTSPCRVPLRPRC